MATVPVLTHWAYFAVCDLGEFFGEGGRVFAGKRLAAPAGAGENVLQCLGFGLGAHGPWGKWRFAERFTTSNC